MWSEGKALKALENVPVTAVTLCGGNAELVPHINHIGLLAFLSNPVAPFTLNSNIYWSNAAFVAVLRLRGYADVFITVAYL